MHDLVRDMCLREVQNENFIHFKTRYDDDDISENVDCLRRVVDYSKYRHKGFPEHMPLTRSVFIKSPCVFCFPSRSCFRLLRILDVCVTFFFYPSESISELVHLRYLACPFFDGLVQSICKLSNIQSLVIHDRSLCGWFMEMQVLAWEVLNMPQLRHIHTKNFGLFIPQPTSLISERETHLQSLTGLSSLSCNHEVFLRLPNLKKLGISLNDASVIIEKCCCLYNLEHLTQLEKLKVKFKEKYLPLNRWRRTDKADPISPRLYIPHCNNFPPKLKKLTLYRTNLQWEDIYFLRKLPNLEVLKLKNDAFFGQIWKLNDQDEDGFLKLKFLLLESMYLKQWEATSYHFPSLERLVITDCYLLEQIPFDFAEVQTLQVIELHKCMLSVLVSAEQIQEEQRSSGNDDLVIRMNYIREKIS